jgi:hypothetical protein
MNDSSRTHQVIRELQNFGKQNFACFTQLCTEAACDKLKRE